LFFSLMSAIRQAPETEEQESRTSPAMAPERLTRVGEFADPRRERAFNDERLPEIRRHLRLLLACALALNLLFFASDARFFGHPFFIVAIVARCVIVLASAVGLRRAFLPLSVAGVQRLCLVWTAAVVAASAALVSTGSDLARFIIFILPIFFYLLLPISFRWALLTGAACSGVTFVSFILNAAPDVRIGFGLELLTLNVVLTLIRIGMNRMSRQEWTARNALERHRGTLWNILRAIPAPMVITGRENGELLQANDAALAYFGVSELSDSQAIAAYFEPRDLVRLVQALRRDGAVSGMESRIRLPDGRERDVLLEAVATSVDETEAVLTVFFDITRRKEIEDHLETLATTDALTGLPNRSHFFARAAAEIQRARQSGHPPAVVMIDIDWFKTINDTHGHEAGDRALRQFARQCRALVRGQDLAARLGGEEFGLLLPETDPGNARAIAERLRRSVEEQGAADLPEGMTISLGIARVRPDEVSIDRALSRADQALYAAKRAGRNRSVDFDEI
jgi:diguanylate cyclase (GGDEF)-like protein/PAS domain S-box-containing protein